MILEEVITKVNTDQTDVDNPEDLSYLLESAIWNIDIHHKAYYGADMNVKPQLAFLRTIVRSSKNQELFRQKKKVEYIKTQITEREQILGRFHRVNDNLHIEKELTIIRHRGNDYLYPTTMLMCALDNIQVRFYIRIHVEIKSIEDNIPRLVEFYDELHDFIIFLRAQQMIWASQFLKTP